MSDAANRAKSIFLNALDIVPEHERAAYIEAQCGDDDQLRCDVVALLDHAHRLGRFLESNAEDGPGTLDPSLWERPGSSIGPYRLLEQLGEGGMGVVFLAEQTEPVARRVALKVIKPGMDTRRVIDRFEAERQALAVMDHPHVAKVLDAGSTETGRPFFVMELVRGEAITAYCDEHELSIRERLELFIPVCQAVQHAHQKGIIHRDLKPSNILVAEFDGHPVPKVIDFGVAKAIDQASLEKTTFTREGQIVGTPEYMSPEQAQSHALVDTRSDVYSLGVVLYELLTGDTPLDRRRLRSSAWDEIMRVIREEEPLTPSKKLSSSDALPSVAARRHVEPVRLSALVRGELDWIVMKALDKDRSRRYESPSALARDIENHLQDQPVLAGPPSAGYRFRKFARRNKRILATVGLVALAMIVGTAASVYHAVRADAERERAQATLRTAIRAVDEMYTQLAEDHLSAAPMTEPMKVQFLEGAVRFYQTLADSNVTDQELCYERAKAFARLGRCQRWLGRAAEAEAALRIAVHELEQLMAQAPDQPVYPIELASCCVHLGSMLEAPRVSEAKPFLDRALTLLQSLGDKLGNNADYQYQLARAHRALAGHHFQTRQFDAAEEHTRISLALWQDQATAFPDDMDRRFQLAESHYGLADVLSVTGRMEDAARHFEETVRLQEEIVTRPPVDSFHRKHLSVTHTAYGHFLERNGRLREAEEQHRKSLRVSAALAQDFPHVPDYRDAWRQSYYELGHQMPRRGHAHGDAEDICRETVALAEALVARWPTIPSFQQQLATAYIDLGFLVLGDRPDDAAELLQQAISLAQKLGTTARDDPENRLILARATNHLGLTHRTADRFSEAESAHRQAMSIAQALVDEYPAVAVYRLELSFAHSFLAQTMQRAGKRAEAEHHLRVCQAFLEEILDVNSEKNFLDISEKNFERNAPFLAETHEQIGHLLRNARRFDEAEASFRQAISLYDRLLAEYPSALRFQMRMLGNMEYLASVYSEGGRLDEAASVCEQTLQLRKATLGPEHADTRSSMSVLAAAYFKAGRVHEAIPLLEQTLELEKATRGPENALTLFIMRNLARTYLAAGRWDEAIALCEQTLQLRKAKLGLEHPDTASEMAGLARAYLGAGRHAEAEKHARECLRIRQETMPDDWRTHNAMALLGRSLAAQQRFADAEPLLLDGYQGMIAREKSIPVASKVNVAEALDAIVQLYEDWDKPEEADRWRQQRTSPPDESESPAPSEEKPEPPPADNPGD